VFIMPPSEDALLQRLRGRKRESEDLIQKRFAEARREMEQAEALGVYDVILVNDDLESTISQAIRIVTDARQGIRATGRI
jgi:guanylate kinase